MYKKLLKSVREYKRPSILTILFIVGEAIIECFIPFVTARLINSLEMNEGDMSSVTKQGLILLVMALVSLCLGGLAGFTSAKASTGFAKNLRGDIFRKIQSFSFSNIDKFSSSSLVTRMTTDINSVQMSYMFVIRILIRAPLLMVFSIFMAYIMGGSLATSFVVIIPFMVLGLALISRKALPAFRAVFHKYDALNESIEENVRGMRVVKGFSREEFEKEKFAKASEDIRNDFTKAERIVNLNSPLMQVCIYFNLVFVLIVGAKVIISSGGTALNVGEISAMLTYGFQIMMQLMMLTMILVMLTMSSEAMKRVVEVLDEESELVSPENGIQEIPNGSVHFNHVHFKYAKDAEKDALSNIQLQIDAGMTVGIIGGTGDGKSSLIQLIPRLYDVSQGSVEVGGIDVRKYDLQALRDAVAVVLQKNVLFSGTIAENLRWGNENATDEELVEACKIAQAHDFIMSFPDHYETKIEQGGSNVSGGQKQRICIARALLKSPKVIILDDSTSAVDTRTEANIRTAFRELIPETTKIIIAQRVSSVQDADLIVIMENGRIAATGQHDELLQTSPIYKEIYEQQMKVGEEDGE